jgi:hypothetical protein
MDSGANRDREWKVPTVELNTIVDREQKERLYAANKRYEDIM